MGAKAGSMILVEAKMDVVLEMMEPGQTLTHKEISQLTGMSRAAAHAIEKRALKKLRVIVQQMYGDDLKDYLINR